MNLAFRNTQRFTRKHRRRFNEVVIDKRQSLQERSEEFDREHEQHAVFGSVPQNLIIKSLKFGLQPKTKILMLGVEKSNSLHGLFLSDLMDSLEPEVTLTPVNCDNPFFIKTQQNYFTAWEHYLRTISNLYRFYVNPLPQQIQEVTMSQ
jgi:hypothetical protein